MKRCRETRAVINLNHLGSNYQILKGLLPRPDTFFCPMVKANGYGHGDVVISKKLAELGVNTLGVGLIEEGALLRENGISQEIIFFGIGDRQFIPDLIENKLTPVISDWGQLEGLESLAPSGYPVHLKFDTGMHRLGFSISEAEKLSEHFRSKSKLKLKALLTHLHTGEDANILNGKSFDQLKVFKIIEAYFKDFNLIHHALNSAGFLNLAKSPELLKSPLINPNLGVRPGLAIYGISPFADEKYGLKPVMSLRSKIIKIHFIRSGEGVSYNQTWKADRDSVIGVVPIGYADGYLRHLSNKANVLVGEKLVPQVGNVCMDYIMVDITEIIKTRKIEDILNMEVTLFGSSKNGTELPASQLAKNAGTIVWEILTSVSVRVPREVEV